MRRRLIRLSKLIFHIQLVNYNLVNIVNEYADELLKVAGVS